MFSLYFDYLIVVISRFGFECGIKVLIAPVPSHCTLLLFVPVVEFAGTRLILTIPCQKLTGIVMLVNAIRSATRENVVAF